MNKIRRPRISSTLADRIGRAQYSVLTKSVAPSAPQRSEDLALNTGAFSYFIPFAKVDPDKREVSGIAVSNKLDNQNEIIEWEATVNAVPEYSKWRNLREMHQPSAVGTVPVIDLDNVQKQMLITAKVVDDDAWRKVKEGVYKGFSVGGEATSKSREFEGSAGKIVSKVKAYKMNEISLVDRPANPDCTFTMVKRDTGARDHLALEVQGLQKSAEALNRMIIPNESLRKLRDSQFALVRKYRAPDGRTRVERLYPITDKPHAVSILKQLGKFSLSKKERTLVHERCKKVLGKSHSTSTCPYCSHTRNLLIQKGGEKQIMALSQKAVQRYLNAWTKLGNVLEAEGILEPIEGEAHIDPETEYLEETGQKPARVKEDFDAGTESLQSPSTKEMEGEDLDELLQELESEGWEGDEGYEETDLPEDDRRTNLFDDEAYRNEKQELEAIETELDGIEEELEALELEGESEEEEEEEEDEEEGKKKSRKVKKADNSDRLMKALILEQHKTQRMLQKLQSRPARKTTATVQKREYGSSDNEGGEALQKAANQLSEDRTKALELRKLQKAGRNLTPDEEAFCVRTMEKSIELKSLGVKSQ